MIPVMVHRSAPRRVLYCGPDPAGFPALVEAMAGGAPVTTESQALRFSHPRADLLMVPAFTVEVALETLASSYVNLLLVDLRGGPRRWDLASRVRELRRLLTALDEVEDLETRYGFHRILVLVSACDGDRVDSLLVELGGHGVRHALKEPDGGDGASFGRAVLDRSLALMLDRQPAKTALCTAGGGTTAIFFELGALKCLDDCFSPGAMNALDMYFGISAGAVVSSLMANGFSADEFMAAIAGVEGGRIAPLSLSLMRLGHLNVADHLRRVRELLWKSADGALDALRGRRLPTLDGLFLEVTASIGPPFRSDRFEEMVRRILTTPGATNDFRALGRELYVGVTNQDARRHVLFGAERPETPISQAVQASLCVNPAFSAVEIGGTWYEDGAVTRTSNFIEAIRRGASLILVLDPFVPYVSKEPGFANRRGMLFNIDQDVRSLSYTRYENARNWALRRYPETSSYTFLPNNRLRRALSVNPMDHRPYMPIFRDAYLGTLARLKQIRHRLSGDLAVHGLSLETDRATEIAARLEAADPLTFADFFVDGRVDIRTPPLNAEVRPASAPQGAVSYPVRPR